MSFYNQPPMNINAAASSSVDWRITLSEDERKKIVSRFFKLFEFVGSGTNQDQRFLLAKKWEEDAFNNAHSKDDYHRSITTKFSNMQSTIKQRKQQQQQQQQQNQQAAAVQQATQNQQLYQMLQQNPALHQKIIQDQYKMQVMQQAQRQITQQQPGQQTTQMTQQLTPQQMLQSFSRPTGPQVSSSPRPQQNQFRFNPMQQHVMNLLKISPETPLTEELLMQVNNLVTSMNKRQQQVQQAQAAQQVQQISPRISRMPTPNLSNAVMNQLNVGSANTATSPVIMATKPIMPQSKGPSRNQTPKLTAAQINNNKIMVQGNVNAVGNKIISVSPVLQQNLNVPPAQGVSTQSQAASNGNMNVNSPVISQNTGMMTQTNSSNLPQASSGINIQNAVRPMANLLYANSGSNSISANSNPLLSNNMMMNKMMMANNSAAIMSNNNAANSIIVNPAAMMMVSQQNNVAALSSQNPGVIARPTQMMGNQTQMVNLNLTNNARPQGQVHVGSSSSTTVIQSGLAILNEKEAQEANNQIATLDARAKERRIQYHEIHDLTDDEKNKIMGKLKELDPMYHEVDNVLPYFWHYTRSSQGTYRLLGMKYMIEDQIKALPDKFLLRLELVDSLLQQFRKYFVFVDSKRRGIEDTTLMNVNPALQQQRPQPQTDILQPRINPSDLKLPMQKHSRDNAVSGSSTTGKKRRQSSADREQPSKKVAPSKSNVTGAQLPEVVIIDPPATSVVSNTAVPASTCSNSVIVIPDDVKSEKQQPPQQNMHAVSSQEVIANIPPPLKEEAPVQKNYIDPKVSNEGCREQAQILIKSLQNKPPPVRAGRQAIEGYKSSQDGVEYHLGAYITLLNSA
ncbi:19123_t:CDS:2 [Funneliformis geosporum]|uniref:19123_t:CDS:1 n=1 Tax=Funneliformis geosporum TaxID=1117311 RepID=A0A9W4SHZ3_9GLOM|nr:19123_t:CDS:2 [Funneliformis geosporum]